jgi:hypothetical protein
MKKEKPLKKTKAIFDCRQLEVGNVRLFYKDGTHETISQTVYKNRLEKEGN